jgi:RNA polymerase sigma-70 factor, ECF subfamily
VAGWVKMPPDASASITALLKAWRMGDSTALATLTPLVYEHLKRLARGYARREAPGGAPQATSLVHEAFIRLVDGAQVDWQDRAHFFAVSAMIMRRILVDEARARHSEKRGGGMVRVDYSRALDVHAFHPADRVAELCALDDALTVLASMDPRRAQVIELRFFGELSVEETAEVLKISPQSVMRDWRLARAWLGHRLRPEAEDQRPAD